CDCADTMADVNVNAPAEQVPAMAPPTRTDDQILPGSRWVPVGKSNCYLDVVKSQSNPIYKIAVHQVDHPSLTKQAQIPPRPDSPLHLPYEEYVLGYLKFSGKGTKREVFGMLIPNDLITDDIRGEQYYNEYLEKVAKHQRYLIGKEVSDPDSPAPKPVKATKPKATKKSKPQPPKPTPTTTEPSNKDQTGKVIKKQKPKSSLQLIDEFVDEGVPDKEPVYGDEEADTQREIEESLKEVHDAHRGLLPPVVTWEPDSRKFQPLPDVQGKGKEKVSNEKVALDLLTLQTPKKKSPAEQYIFQRRSSAPTEPSSHDESSSLYAELGLTDSEMKSDEEVPGTDAGDQDEGQAGPNPGIQDEGQAGSNPGDAAVSQPQSFENLKLPTEDQVRLEEPASSARTLSSLQNLDKELSFADQFLVEKSQEEEPEKTNTESEVQSMVIVPIHQDTSYVPLMTTPVIDLTVSQPVSTTVQAPLPTSTATVSKAVDEIVTDAVDWAIQAPLKDRFRDLPEADMKEILHHCMWETKSYEAHEDHKNLYEALEKSIDRDHSDQLLTDLAEARRKKKRSHESPKTPPGSPPHQPPPPPPPAGPSGIQELLALLDLTSAEYTDWTTTDTRLKSSVSSIPEDLHMDADSAPDKQWINDAIIRHNVSKPLLLGGQPGQVTIQVNFFFNKYLEYLRYGSKGGRPALSISKIKAAYYPDVGLEKMVPDQMWIEEECKYDIAAMYGISHWWFQRQRFYIDRHTSEGDRKAVQTHMCILSVLLIWVQLHEDDRPCRADLNEYIITERDFKYLYQCEFEDLYLLNL
ncbi:hypothetical protein Tco_0857975, partial [Tanacetum coccineum]